MTLFERARSEAEHLLDLPGVVGTGEGESPGGRRSIVVLVTARSKTIDDRIPQQIHGVPVTILEVGTLSAEPAGTVDSDGRPRDS